MQIEDFHRLGDDPSDRHPRIERGEWVLKDHLDLLAIGPHGPVDQPVDPPPFPKHFARCDRHEVEDRPRGG